jgi:hypothetical protein
MSSTHITRHINAPRAKVYGALVEADAIAKWKVAVAEALGTGERGRYLGRKRARLDRRCGWCATYGLARSRQGDVRESRALRRCATAWWETLLERDLGDPGGPVRKSI